MMKTLLLFMLVPVLLSGCSTRWVKIRDNPTDHVTSRTLCRVSAEQRFPVRNEVINRTNYRTVTEPCDYKRWCGGQKYRTYDVEKLQSYVTDVNDGSRNSSYHDCMLDNGWQQQTKSNWEWDRTPITLQYTGPAK
ncbi:MULTISPECIES: hypothetical protein [Symbiopectobacterium]|uniref:hypothetical protein n=1 Tax=Symbiopectobacterium TaxID=801 RepID=UPI001A1FA415|nr:MULTISPECIES: hypothetical protein [Symbiopectobacterium]MBG6248821.1 hypothetical protein [Candidatus Symbiopectobacterium sp. PLON1]MBT9430394.1 hypothetical protein [Candidatus Symbiopectobacterium endolongispinus]